MFGSWKAHILVAEKSESCEILRPYKITYLVFIHLFPKKFGREEAFFYSQV